MTPTEEGTPASDLSRALLESEEKFRVLAENASVGVLIRRPAESTFVNRALCEIFEETREDLMALGFMERLIHPDDLPNTQDKVRRIRAGKLDAAHFFARACVRSGTVRQLEVFASRLGYAKGEATLLVVVDRTEQHRLEVAVRAKNAELQALASELEKRVAEEVEKHAAREAIFQGQAKMAAMGEMLAAIAHQWRQPVSTLGMVLQNLVGESLAGTLDHSRLEEAVKRARQQLTFLTQTVDSFLSFYRPDRGEGPFDLLPIVLETASLLKAQLDYHFMELAVDPGAAVGSQPLAVEGRPNDLKQVLVILLQNAKDAILERRSREPRAPSRIDVRVLGEGAAIRIEIEDTGGGIPDEVASRIFEPYFSTKPRGTGIGLAMARTLVTTGLRGSLSAANGPQGARFTLLVPTAGA